MKQFDYVVLTTEGIKTRGRLRVSNEEMARENLKKKYAIIISVTERLTDKTYFWQKPHLSYEEKMMFAKYMAIMSQVGITITESLEIIISQTTSSSNRMMYEDILERVSSGQTLADALRVYEVTFSEIFINMVQVGEKSGTLESVLTHLAVQIEKAYELKKKIISAFIYPAIIVSMTLTITLGMVIFVMPKILEIFKNFDVVLPLPTRILVGVSTFILTHPFGFIVLIFGVLGGTTLLSRIRWIRPIYHRVLLHTAIFGKILIYMNLARFARTLNSLLEAGIPITEGLQITANMMGNTFYKNALLSAKERIKRGGGLGDGFTEHPKLFPPLVKKMLYIGERTGSLETSTKHLARLYERNVDNMTKNLSVLLEPFLLIFMGILIGGIALSIILPIYQLPNLISNSR